MFRLVKNSVVGLLLWLFFGNAMDAPWQAPGVTHHFGISINPTANNGLLTYGIVSVNTAGKVVRTRIIPRDNFILQVSGLQTSEANPKREDFWKNHEIGACYYVLNTLQDKYDPLECTPLITLEDLWRLRYKRNPQYSQYQITANQNGVDGWAANNFRPNWPQLQMLQKFGVTYPNDFFYGTQLFDLMKAVQDPDWQNNYKAAG